ncbi:hypothetical protein [Streptomyces sp. NPDC056948]|uniref:hypothetical protein n=1 Tax=Streptomyces sp. NPDC056948 TaxID=3345975 RepID=UPI003635ABB4
MQCLHATPAAATNLQDLAVTPDGKDVVTASGVVPYCQAVYITLNGDVAAGTFSWYDPDVHVFKPGVSTPLRQYDFPNTGTSSGADTLAPAGLAWAPDESKLFAISENSSDVYSLRVFDAATKAE